MFPHAWDEAEHVSRSQSVILKRRRNIKYASYTFTEQRVGMLSSVLHCLAVRRHAPDTNTGVRFAALEKNPACC